MHLVVEELRKRPHHRDEPNQAQNAAGNHRELRSGDYLHRGRFRVAFSVTGTAVFPCEMERCDSFSTDPREKFCTVDSFFSTPEKTLK